MGISVVVLPFLVIAFVTSPARATESAPTPLDTGPQLLQTYTPQLQGLNQGVNGFFQGAVKEGLNFIPSVAGGTLEWLGFAKNQVGSIDFANYISQAKQISQNPQVPQGAAQNLVDGLRTTFYEIINRSVKLGNDILQSITGLFAKK